MEDARSNNPQDFVETVSKCVAARLLNFVETVSKCVAARLLNSNHTKLSFTSIYTTEAEFVACIVAFLFPLDTLVSRRFSKWRPREILQR